ncbi:MAG: hypothetical protein QOE04_1305, partial [Mycobacterium sp.]|nr:hypothetical protein [Mycobacterium sp.]
MGVRLETRTVDSHVKALRRKLGSELIRTVHGVGYALPHAVLVAGVVALLGVAALNPERLIAERNIDRYEQTG